ncbi:prokineticin receptor 1-like [Glandiceps talaboti]
MYPEYSDGDNFVTNSPVHPAAQVILCLVYSLMIVVCGIGNVLLVFILLRYRKMRTVPNLLIANLALSDLLVALLSAPFYLTSYMMRGWPFSENICIAAAYINRMSLYVSTNSLLVIAIDRYVVIVTMVKLAPRTRAITAATAIVLIWIISSVVVTPTALFTEVRPFYENGKTFHFCGEFWPHREITALKVYDMFILVVEFIIPLAIMAFCYAGISLKLWKHKVPGAPRQSQYKKKHGDSKKKSIRILVTIVILFAVCWVPFYSYAIFRDFFPLLHNEYRQTFNIFYIVEALANGNSMVNTTIYIIMNKNVLRRLRGLSREIRSRRSRLVRSSRRQSLPSKVVSQRDKTIVEKYPMMATSVKANV